MKKEERESKVSNILKRISLDKIFESKIKWQAFNYPHVWKYLRADKTFSKFMRATRSGLDFGESKLHLTSTGSPLPHLIIYKWKHFTEFLGYLWHCADRSGNLLFHKYSRWDKYSDTYCTIRARSAVLALIYGPIRSCFSNIHLVAVASVTILTSFNIFYHFWIFFQQKFIRKCMFMA